MYVPGKLFLLLQDLNKKRCERCSLHYEKHHDKCPHCSDMNDFALKVYLEQRGLDPNAKDGLWSFIVFAGIVILVIFLLSILLKT